MRPPEYYVEREELEEAVDCLLRNGAEKVTIRRSGSGYVIVPARIVDGCPLREVT
ncbi:MAG: hypothetical protein ACP5ID_06700 [Conexivisphaera sp.]